MTDPTPESGRELDARATVTAKCVGCGHRRKIRPGEVPEGRMPSCSECYMPMVAVRADTEGADAE